MQKKCQDFVYNTILTKLIYLTKRNNLSNTEIGKVINVERRAICGRADRNSEFKAEEVDELQKHFNVNFNEITIIDNSGERQNDLNVDEKSSQFGKRLSALQAKHNFLDSEMAKLLEVTHKTYLALVTGNKQPTLDILNRIKQNFKVSVDYLLYGD